MVKIELAITIILNNRQRLRRQTHNVIFYFSLEDLSKPMLHLLVMKDPHCSVIIDWFIQGFGIGYERPLASGR